MTALLMTGSATPASGETGAAPGTHEIEPWVERALTNAIHELAEQSLAVGVLLGSVRALSATVAWESAAARAFRSATERLIDDVSRLVTEVDGVESDVRRLRDRERTGPVGHWS